MRQLLLQNELKKTVHPKKILGKETQIIYFNAIFKQYYSYRSTRGKTSRIRSNCLVLQMHVYFLTSLKEQRKAASLTFSIGTISDTLDETVQNRTTPVLKLLSHRLLCKHKRIKHHSYANAVHLYFVVQ